MGEPGTEGGWSSTTRNEAKRSGDKGLDHVLLLSTLRSTEAKERLLPGICLRWADHLVLCGRIANERCLLIHQKIYGAAIWLPPTPLRIAQEYICRGCLFLL